MKTTQHNLLDDLVCQFDLALKTLVPGSSTAQRTNPASSVDETELSTSEKEHAAGLMRINHTGEVCAQALYQGQSLTAKLPEVRESMNAAAQEEIDHLSWCDSRLNELDSRTSVLNPLWYSLSFGIGAAAGLAGDKWSLGFVAETENQVCEHLNEHLAQLPEGDEKSQAILKQMLIDEAEHETTAREAGAAELPFPIKTGMTLMSQVMKKLAYRV